MNRARVAWATSLILHASAAGALFWAWNSGLKIGAGSAASPIISIEAVEITSGETSLATPPREKHRQEALARAPQLSSSVSAGTSSGGNSSAIGVYLALVRDKLSREIHAPRDGGGRALRVTLEMTLKSDGGIARTAIRESSGLPSFDESVLEASRRAVPFPRFTAQMGNVQQLTVQIPVEIRAEHEN